LREAWSAARVIRRGFLGMGLETKAFEEELSDFLGYPVACTVNGTAAIQLGLQALDVKPQDEVLVPSLTYLATFQAISALGAIPVACDVIPGSLAIDLNHATELLSERTKVILPVHFGGEFRQRETVAAFARKNKLRVLEDAAHAFGSLDDDFSKPKPIDLIAYSFDGIKNITSGEGGCLVGVDPVVLRRVADIRLLGVQGDTSNRYSGKRSWDFDVVEQGWRYHMSDVMAAIGRVQLKRQKTLAAKRKRLAGNYDRLLLHSDIETMPVDYKRSVPHIYPVLLPERVDRNVIRGSLELLGVQTGVHYKPNHSLSFYKSSRQLPVTESVYKRIISLPLHPSIRRRDQLRVVNSLLELIDPEPKT
jgi:dTDP-4-amino-4,6-dideoxygalactose transaminase